MRQLIASLPQLLAGEGSVIVAAAAFAISSLPVDVCARLMLLPEPDRRQAVLRLAQEPGGAACVVNLKASYRPTIPVILLQCREMLQFIH
jgi:hypothetical protein